MVNRTRKMKRLQYLSGEINVDSSRELNPVFIRQVNVSGGDLSRDNWFIREFMGGWGPRPVWTCHRQIMVFTMYGFLG